MVRIRNCTVYAFDLLETKGSTSKKGHPFTCELMTLTSQNSFTQPISSLRYFSLAETMVEVWGEGGNGLGWLAWGPIHTA